MREPALTEYDPPRPRLTGDERRRTILHAARCEFARVGYYGASTASIARVAGCSEPMLYKHFAGKLDLFIAALADAAERFFSTFDMTAPPEGDLRERGLSYVRRIMADPDYLQFIQLRRLAISVDEPRVRDLLTSFEEQVSDRISVSIRYGIDNGTMSPDVDPDYVAFMWLGMMQAAAYRESLDPGQFGASARHIEFFMHSLTPLA